MKLLGSPRKAGVSGVDKAPPATHPCHHGAGKQDRATGPALVPWGLSVRGGPGLLQLPESALASPAAAFYRGHFLSRPSPRPAGQSRPTPAKVFAAARKALGPVGTPGVIARPLSPSRLPALHPTSHGVWGERHPLNNGGGRKGAASLGCPEQAP